MLLGVYVFPLWRIDLIAPQYPEGLGMLIRVNAVSGIKPNDLDNINGLNHYIGMKAINAEAIPELRFMPWIVATLVVTGLATAALGKRRLLYTWVGLFGAVAIAGLIDFWRWEYDYGHNLDMTHAIIKVPGMTYQPPLIGSRQLLNFTATSWPSFGGVLAGLALLLGIAAIVTRSRRKHDRITRQVAPRTLTPRAVFPAGI
jgi:copper chaperone NosL